ncbi:MAG: S24/S26 family peptidase [Lachnospiraceae bacterium]|nr:S24/S26 family peptidase [Lachnospiraceae bacterium]
MSKSSFEEILACDGRLIYSNVGDSMLPLICQGRDLVVIVPPAGRLKKYDIPLYKRDSGQYVLHRILKVREKDYVICGDNRWRREYGITDWQIIGVLSAVIRDGKEILLSDWRLRLFARLWCGLFPLRALFLRGLRILSRLGGQR